MMGWNRFEAIGRLASLWHESQELMRSVATAADLAAWAELEGDVQSDHFVAGLVECGYVHQVRTRADGVVRYEIHGNAVQIEGRVGRTSRGCKGGRATREKWRAIRAAEAAAKKPEFQQESVTTENSVGLEALPQAQLHALPEARLLEGSNLAQCKAMQGNAVQGNAMQFTPPPNAPAPADAATEPAAEPNGLSPEEEEELGSLVRLYSRRLGKLPATRERERFAEAYAAAGCPHELVASRIEELAQHPFLRAETKSLMAVFDAYEPMRTRCRDWEGRLSARILDGMRRGKIRTVADLVAAGQLLGDRYDADWFAKWSESLAAAIADSAVENALPPQIASGDREEAQAPPMVGTRQSANLQTRRPSRSASVTGGDWAAVGDAIRGGGLDGGPRP